MSEQPGYQPEQVQQKKDLHVFFPGATGGGKALTQIRTEMVKQYGIDNVLVPSSITTPESLKKGQTAKQRLTEMAQEILAKNPDSLKIIAHSFGSYETLDLIKSLLALNYQGDINVAFIGTPGLIDKGIPGLINFGKRVMEMGKQVTVNEQHMFYPLPDKFYDTKDKPSDLIWTDDNPKRQKRRETFTKSLDNLVADPDKKQAIISQLQQIDSQLLLANEEEQVALANRRNAILAPLLQDVFHGKDIDPEKASFFQEYYGETPDKLIGNLGFMAQMIGYCGGIFGRIHQGIGAEIANLKKTAEQKQTNLSFGYAILENDSIIKPTDLQNLETPDLINLLGTVETYAHSSIAYHPEEIIPAINEKL